MVSDKTKFTALLELITIGVKAALLIKDKEFKFKVAVDDTIIFLSVWEPVNSYVPSVDIVTI